MAESPPASRVMIKYQPGLLPWLAIALLLLLTAIKPAVGLYVSIGFMVGYGWGYLRVFAQLEKMFGSSVADRMWNYFKDGK